MRRMLVAAVLLLAGCGSKGPEVVPQSRPAPDAARLSAARDCMRRAEESLAVAPDNFLRNMAIDDLIVAEARLGDTAAARKLAETTTKQMRATALIDIAREQGLNGDLAGARDTFQAARSLIDDQNNFHGTILAKAQATVGDLAAARKTLVRLPQDCRTEVLVELAECERKAGAIADAKDDLTTARKIQRNDPDGRPYLVLAWYRLGDVATAEACILEMPKNLHQARAWMSLADAQCEAGDIPGALASVKRAQAVWPPHDGPINARFFVRVRVAELFARCGEAPTAKTLFAAAKEDVPRQFNDKAGDPRQTIAYGQIAAAQTRGGDVAGAAETLKLALAAIPGLPDDATRALGLWGLASDQAARGDTAQALSLVAQSRQYVIPDSSDINYFMNLGFEIEAVAAAAAANDPPDLTWIERLPMAGGRAIAYAKAACVLSAAPKTPPAGAPAKP